MPLFDTQKPVEARSGMDGLLDQSFASMIAGSGMVAVSEGRKDISCQNGIHYARIRFGSGTKRRKEHGGYVYKGKVERYRNDPRWKKRIGEYAAKHACHYGARDLQEVGGVSSSGIGNGTERSDTGGGSAVARLPVHGEGWESWASRDSLPS